MAILVLLISGLLYLLSLPNIFSPFYYFMYTPILTLIYLILYSHIKVHILYLFYF
jgi:hypothetical protein